MTVVIADKERGIMAADSKFFEEGIAFPCKKLYRIAGSIWGESGETRGTMKFLEWVRGGKHDKKRPTFSAPEDDFYCLELNKEGLFYWDKHLYGVEVDERYCAIGSGGELAMMAVKEFNLTVEQAVEATTKYCHSTGMPVQVMELK